MSEVSDKNSAPRWYQLTVRRLMWATVWVAAGLGIYYAIMTPSDYGMFFNTHPFLTMGLLVVVFATPFAAVGALFGHSIRGLIVGLILVGSFAISIYVAIDSGWVPI